MLLRSSQLINLPIMSLQTGKEIAVANQLIINPDNMRIVALELAGDKLDEQPSFLRIEDIRELGNLGFIVDSSEEFVGLNDVISLKNVREKNFYPINMRVIDDHKHKLGKVYDTVFNTDNFIIEQICVKRPLFQSLGDTELIIHRNQIIDIQDKNIVVRNTAIKAGHKKSKRSSHINKQLTNPFTKPQSSPQPETSTTAD